jgi:hypothetical protein
MAMTEAEAKTKWCPNARAAVYAGAAAATVNRYPDPRTIEDLCRCIGSRCMFWRWDSGSSARARAAAVAQRPTEKAAAMSADATPTEGYCGQAGPA